MYRTTGQRVFADSQMHPLLRPDLVGCWIGGGSGLTWFDRSGYGNHGTLINGPTWTLGKDNLRNALLFDNTDDYIAIDSPSLSIGTGDYTWAAFIFPTILPGVGENYKMIMSRATSYSYLSLINIANLAFDTLTGFNLRTTTSPIIVSAWQHVAAVRKDGVNTIFYNATPLVSVADTGSYTSTIHNIGRYATGSSLYFSGIIDDVRIYRRALSVAELTILANV